MSSFFARKIAKNVKTGSILANFSFFVKFFARKMRKMSNSREKLSKMVKTGFILANVVFFVKVQTDNAPFCSSGSPDPERFEIRRSQTTDGDN